MRNTRPATNLNVQPPPSVHSSDSSHHPVSPSSSRHHVIHMNDAPLMRAPPASLASARTADQPPPQTTATQTTHSQTGGVGDPPSTSSSTSSSSSAPVPTTQLTTTTVGTTPAAIGRTTVGSRLELPPPLMWNTREREGKDRPREELAAQMPPPSPRASLAATVRPSHLPTLVNMPANSNPDEWNEEVRAYLYSIAFKCKNKRRLHFWAHSVLRNRHNWITILTIVLGTAVTAVSQLDPTWRQYKFVVGFLAFWSTTLAAIVKFLGYETVAAQHCEISTKFLELRDDIRINLSTPPRQRPYAIPYMRQIGRSYRNLTNAAPGMPVNCFSCRRRKPQSSLIPSALGSVTPDRANSF